MITRLDVLHDFYVLVKAETADPNVGAVGPADIIRFNCQFSKVFPQFSLYKQSEMVTNNNGKWWCKSCHPCRDEDGFRIFWKAKVSLIIGRCTQSAFLTWVKMPMKLCFQLIYFLLTQSICWYNAFDISLAPPKDNMHFLKPLQTNWRLLPSVVFSCVYLRQQGSNKGNIEGLKWVFNQKFIAHKIFPNCG